MQHLQNILKKFVRDFGLESGTALNSIRKKWAELVGATIAAHTSPETIRGKTLTVIVDSPQWMHHLGFFKDEISRKLESCSVKEIRFRLGKLPEKNYGTQEEKVSELTDEDLEYIENTVGSIHDEEIRNTFRKLITRGLTRKKK